MKRFRSRLMNRYSVVLPLALFSVLTIATTLVADEWPQWRGPTRDGVWNEQGVIDQFSESQIKVSWRAPIGSGYSGPTVADGRVYVTDRVVHETEEESKQIERVHCFDAKTGESVWTHTYDCTYSDIGYTAGPRAAVTLDQGRAFALGAMGHLHALDAASGEVLWSKDLNTEYKIRMPIWGIASAPIVVDARFPGLTAGISLSSSSRLNLAISSCNTCISPSRAALNGLMVTASTLLGPLPVTQCVIGRLLIN